RPIAEALAARGLPHVVIGGHGFHDRAEIRDVIALLRVLRDPADVIALARVLTRPLLELAEDEVLPQLRTSNVSALEAIEAWTPAAGFARLLSSLARRAQTLDVRDLFFELMERTRYLDSLTSGLETSEAARASA